ncbi:hypothetical protein PV05_07911 [Exophiala xenobiotica]|uniref:Uncharacterized protein n=1 Tax=Exophiala xenobiotica TaxID=348802 RepID=A0A0D2EWP5_9EURO|nr:uncharacterized protein PV05_07911 [Exophiala xenobiotica]KIW52259.1 hypothetical protein PV05_07911 [Exophiala xenobiotica]
MPEPTALFQFTMLLENYSANNEYEVNKMGPIISLHKWHFSHGHTDWKWRWRWPRMAHVLDSMTSPNSTRPDHYIITSSSYTTLMHIPLMTSIIIIIDKMASSTLKKINEIA